MAKSKPVTDQSADPGGTAIASAVRTLGLEAEGLSALAAALRDGLGRPFIAAIELIGTAKGRVIVTGMGKSGHIARKIAATLSSTGTPAFFVHAGDAGHGDLGMITAERRHHGVVLVGRDHRTQDADRLFPPLPDRPDRRHGIGRQHARQGSRCGAHAAGRARSLPAQSRPDHICC